MSLLFGRKVFFLLIFTLFSSVAAYAASSSPAASTEYTDVSLRARDRAAARLNRPGGVNTPGVGNPANRGVGTVGGVGGVGAVGTAAVVGAAASNTVPVAVPVQQTPTTVVPVNTTTH